jgi:hypothetical protein
MTDYYMLLAVSLRREASASPPIGAWLLRQIKEMCLSFCRPDDSNPSLVDYSNKWHEKE